MDNSIIFVITVVSAIIIGYVAVKRHWKIADIF